MRNELPYSNTRQRQPINGLAAAKTEESRNFSKRLSMLLLVVAPGQF
ncbi:MAG: hypothetical protein AABN95_08320 [Acidobacteriota bacterium]